MSDTNEDPYDGFQAVHAAHEAEIYAFILDRVKNPEDAEGLTVEAFVNAYRSWPKSTIDLPMPVVEWLRLIADNNCKRHGARGTVE